MPLNSWSGCRIEHVAIGVHNATLMNVIIGPDTEYPLSSGNHFTLRTSLGDAWVENMRLENYERIVQLKTLRRVEVLVLFDTGKTLPQRCFIVDSRIPRSWLINTNHWRQHESSE